MSRKPQTRERLEAWNRHDPQAFAAFYANDAKVYDPMYPEPLTGRGAVRKDFEEFLTAFPDTNLSLGAVVESGDTVAFELISRGTHKGQLPGRTGPIAATNRHVDMPMAVFSRLDDEGLVVEERRYYDLAGVRQQLGLTE